ncbi:MAG: hypothetical protein K8T25_18390 [Planctomycetia bacterium]|nr:hypothetical protein [Planctomycetia bacterium]
MPRFAFTFARPLVAVTLGMAAVLAAAALSIAQAAVSERSTSAIPGPGATLSFVSERPAAWVPFDAEEQTARAPLGLAPSALTEFALPPATDWEANLASESPVAAGPVVADAAAGEITASEVAAAGLWSDVCGEAQSWSWIGGGIPQLAPSSVALAPATHGYNALALLVELQTPAIAPWWRPFAALDQARDWALSEQVPTKLVPESAPAATNAAPTAATDVASIDDDEVTLDEAAWQDDSAPQAEAAWSGTSVLKRKNNWIALADARIPGRWIGAAAYLLTNAARIEAVRISRAIPAVISNAEPTSVPDRLLAIWFDESSPIAPGRPLVAYQADEFSNGDWESGDASGEQPSVAVTNNDNRQLGSSILEANSLDSASPVATNADVLAPKSLFAAPAQTHRADFTVADADNPAAGLSVRQWVAVAAPLLSGASKTLHLTADSLQAWSIRLGLMAQTAAESATDRGILPSQRMSNQWPREQPDANAELFFGE